ncbi:RipA family octameric membrane protein [Streptomyces albogriseolus]
METDRDGDRAQDRAAAAAVPAPRSPAPSEPAGHPDVLELYKLAVEMADRVSARRGSANAFFLSVQTALVSLIGFGMSGRAGPPGYVSVAVAMGGITLSLAWWLQLRTYRHLNSAKFRVINGVEERLPVRIFTDEWAALRGTPEPRRLRRYAELGASERIVPLVFALAHLVLLAGTLFE